MEETSVDKQNKLLNLRLSNGEWERVKEFLGLLKVRYHTFYTSD